MIYSRLFWVKVIRSSGERWGKESGTESRWKRAEFGGYTHTLFMQVGVIAGH